MHSISEVLNGAEKSRICNDVLRSLPNWFGIEQSIVDYTNECADLPMYAAFSGSEPVGFVAIKPHNSFAAEVCVMGVVENFHRKGIGKELIGCCEDYCRSHKMEFLTVKTVDESSPDLSYKKTRMFYRSVGFKPLEVFKTLWDERNPCLFMVKIIDFRTKNMSENGR